MKAALVAVSMLLPALRAGAASLRRTAVALGQEPDTACGKGFDELVPGSKDYFATASVELFTHPGHLTDNATFATELKCWFAHMNTQQCGGLPSQADARKKPLTAACQSVTATWYDVWNMFSPEEVKYFKAEYPAKQQTEGEELEPNSKVSAEPAGAEVISYKEAMETVKEVDKKEVLCLTLFTIDDECVKWSYIRLA